MLTPVTGLATGIRISATSSTVPVTEGVVGTAYDLAVLGASVDVDWYRWSVAPATAV